MEAHASLIPVVLLSRKQHLMYRASDNSREKKKEISRDLKRQIRGENGLFRGNFRGKFSMKSKQESKKERFLTKILEGCQIQGKKETQ